VNDRFVIHEQLGEGSYGVIFRGFDLLNVLWKGDATAGLQQNIIY
jgi:serine/threonine protein kinase